MGIINATVYFNNTNQVIIKEFEGLCNEKYHWCEIGEEWDYFPIMAERRFKTWRDNLLDEKFVTIGDKLYPTSQISHIDVKKEPKIITVK